MLEPLIARAQKATTIRVPSARTIPIARIKCQQGTCTVRKITVRYNIGGRVLNGRGTTQATISEGKSAVVKSTVPRNVFRQLVKGRKSGTVTVVVTATSSNGTRNVNDIRSGLLR